MIPAFTSEGLLPAGRYATTPSEIEARFVDTFPASTTRKPIFEGWRKRRGALLALVPVEFEWVDGSFVTVKRDPGDVDVLTVIRVDDYQALSAAGKKELLSLTTGSRPFLEFSCHSYVAVDFEGSALWTQARQDGYQSAVGYWDRQWARVRGHPGVEKGYLDVRGAT